jgi:hypothetical protein
MSTLPQKGLKSTAPTIVGRHAKSPFCAKDLMLLAATLSHVAPSERETWLPRQRTTNPSFARVSRNPSVLCYWQQKASTPPSLLDTLARRPLGGRLRG